MVEDNTEAEFVSSEEICPGEREIRMFRISGEMFPVGLFSGELFLAP